MTNISKNELRQTLEELVDKLGSGLVKSKPEDDGGCDAYA